MKNTEQILHDYQEELLRIGKSQNTVKGYLSNVSMFLRWTEETSGEPFNGTLTPCRVFVTFFITLTATNLLK